MQTTVSGSTPFKVYKNTCAIGPTSQGFVLKYGVSKEGPWTAYDEATPADECLVINGLVPYMWLKLDGNVDEATEIIL